MEFELFICKCYNLVLGATIGEEWQPTGGAVGHIDSNSIGFVPQPLIL